jgi:hypothetical protein
MVCVRARKGPIRSRGVAAALTVATVSALTAAGATAGGTGGGTASPDGEVKAKGGAFIGLGQINSSGDGQTARAKVERGKRTSFSFRFKNVGDAASDFEVGGCSVADEEVDVTYKFEGADVTDEVNGGLLTIPGVGPTVTTSVVKAKVSVPRSTPRGTIANACVPAVAQNPPNNRDEPEWRVRVR